MHFIYSLGTDATNNFEDAGHSNDARGMMKEYEIGELNEVNAFIKLFLKSKN